MTLTLDSPLTLSLEGPDAGLFTHRRLDRADSDEIQAESRGPRLLRYCTTDPATDMHLQREGEARRPQWRQRLVRALDDQRSGTNGRASCEVCRAEGDGHVWLGLEPRSDLERRRSTTALTITGYEIRYRKTGDNHCYRTSGSSGPPCTAPDPARRQHEPGAPR